MLCAAAVPTSEQPLLIFDLILDFQAPKRSIATAISVLFFRRTAQGVQFERGIGLREADLSISAAFCPINVLDTSTGKPEKQGNSFRQTPPPRCPQFRQKKGHKNL
ncbi:MAG: hypothetical protein WCJ21_08265 [Planctomycetota bacterium]